MDGLLTSSTVPSVLFAFLNKKIEKAFHGVPDNSACEVHQTVPRLVSEETPVQPERHDRFSNPPVTVTKALDLF